MDLGTILNILPIVAGLIFYYLARNSNVDQGALFVSAGLFIFTLVARFCVFNKEYLWEHPLLGIGLLLGIFICGDILYRAEFRIEGLFLEGAATPPDEVTADPERCKAILSFKRGYIIDDGQPTSRLRARALPNKRLELAFGIDNAFTTTEKKYHNEFLSDSQRSLNIGNGDWSRLSQWARPFARARIARKKETCNIVTVIQMMTLNMALQIFLKRDDSNLLDDDLAQLASEINRLWINSKSPDTIQPWAEQEQLHRILRNLIPESHHDPCSPRENPMNLILPSYETLWRVVLRCFLELNFRPRYAAHAPRWRAAVRFFMENVGGWHMDNRTVNGISATDVAKEALRLYPPTRRVYRTTHSGRSVAADIEALHRDPTAWPGDGHARATNFCPERWMEDGVNQDAFLAFGAGPFACPARGGFGPKAVALLVGALTEAVGVKDERGRGWVVDGRFADVMAAEEPLGSGREAFDGLRLRRGGGSEKGA